MLWHKEGSQLISKKPKNYGMVLKNIELQNSLVPLVLKNYKSHLQVVEF